MGEITKHHKSGKGNTMEDVPQNTWPSLAAASSVGQDSVLCPRMGLPVGGGLPVVMSTLHITNDE